VAVAQPDQLGADRGDLAVAPHDRLAERFDAAGVGLPADLEQLALLLDQRRTDRGERRVDHELAARRLGLEPRHLGASDLEAAGELGELGRDQLGIEGHQRVAGLHALALDHVDLGDAAAVPNTRTPGQLDPPTSQHALRQARRLAKNLAGDPQPYGYRMLGQVATLGRYKGVADVMGLRFRGFPGWFLTRTYHLLQLPLLSRKLRVVTDWTTSLFFRRDIAELSMLGHPHRLDE